MKPTFEMYLLTTEGEAVITTEQPWEVIGEYTVTGAGAEMAREWIENAYGAVGHS